MNEEELREYKIQRGQIEFKKVYSIYNNSQTPESEDEYADRSETPELILPLPSRYRYRIEPRCVNRNEIDRSFTDLGYIGFGNGIEIDMLDSTGNWQFIN